MSGLKLDPRKPQSKHIVGMASRLINSIKFPFKVVHSESTPAESASTVTSAFTQVVEPDTTPVTDSLGRHDEVTRVVLKSMISPLPSHKQDEVWAVDKVVPAELRDLLESRLDAIASGPYKEYSPGTDDKVQVLINPSMYPYIKGISHLSTKPLLKRRLRLFIFRGPREISKYQWLPAQFYVGEDGSTSIKSYINNLDFFNRDLYRAIELVFSYFLPMFETLLDKRLQSRELQVIVKAANYVIQPKDAAYAGMWHVEGMPHEHIVASGIYYYSTSPHLVDNGLELRRQDPMDMFMDTAETVEGRLVAFSNLLQHKVSGITNSSTDRVGTRKILTFFLIDPKEEIISTKHVPEQQWDIIRLRVLEALDDVVMKIMGKIMPMEILLLITEWAKTGLTLKEALEHRDALVKDRRFKIDANLHLIHRDPCNLD